MEIDLIGEIIIETKVVIKVIILFQIITIEIIMVEIIIIIIGIIQKTAGGENVGNVFSQRVKQKCI